MTRNGHSYPDATATWSEEMIERDEDSVYEETEDDKGAYWNYPDE